MFSALEVARSSTPASESSDPIPSDALYEVIDGEIVELPSMGTRQEVFTSKMQVRVGRHVDVNNLGHFVVETLFDFTEQVGHKRRPDLAFVSKDRWPLTREPPDRDGWPVVPNLAIEVVSRSNLWEAGWEKIAEYFQVGVERVWAIGL
ncbi:MAG: Uma2 family endonuclease, partial [Planctomycetota bacterium]|nr:Uma2 family endonuclease [Planctomycetota bacterium]